MESLFEKCPSLTVFVFTGIRISRIGCSIDHLGGKNCKKTTNGVKISKNEKCGKLALVEAAGRGNLLM